MPPVPPYDPYSDPNALMRKDELAALLNLSPRTLELWRQEDRGPPFVRLSKTLVRYRRGDVLNWIKQHGIEGGAA